MEIFPKFSLLPLLIWSTVSFLFFFVKYGKLSLNYPFNPFLSAVNADVISIPEVKCWPADLQVSSSRSAEGRNLSFCKGASIALYINP